MAQLQREKTRAKLADISFRIEQRLVRRNLILACRPERSTKTFGGVSAVRNWMGSIVPFSETPPERSRWRIRPLGLTMWTRASRTTHRERVVPEVSMTSSVNPDFGLAATDPDLLTLRRLASYITISGATTWTRSPTRSLCPASPACSRHRVTLLALPFVSALCARPAPVPDRHRSAARRRFSFDYRDGGERGPVVRNNPAIVGWLPDRRHRSAP